MTERPSPPPWHPLAWADALNQFGRTETAGGVVLVLALGGALVWANVDGHSYGAVWAHLVATRSEPIPPSLHSVANQIDNGLMTIFFLAVGLEMGREVAEGSLRDRRNALLPVFAALCGMAGAAATYLIAVAILRPHVGIARGWGVPMATDVAFTLGAIALLGTRVPRPLRVFVLALAVADDVASVAVLALVASRSIHLWWLLAAVVTLAAVILVRRVVRHAWWPYLLATALLWYFFVRGGVEPPLAGAFVGLLIPMSGGARAGIRLEGPVHALSSYLVLPLFVLANGGVTLTRAVWHSPTAVSLITAVVSARTLGKMIGITLGVALLVRLGVCNLPERTTWRHIVGVGLLCGMGITVPLLFAHAIFGGTPTLYEGSQIGLLIGTLAAAVLGSVVMISGRRPASAATATPALHPARATVPAAHSTGPASLDPDDPKEG